MKKEEENKKKRMKQMKKDELIALRHDADELYDEEQLIDEEPEKEPLDTKKDQLIELADY